MRNLAVPPEKPFPRASWIILAAVTVFTGLNGPWVALTPAPTQTDLGARTWEQFAPAEPGLARVYALDLVILGLSLAAFSFLGTVVAAIPYQRSEKWAWFALWLVPRLYGGVALAMLRVQYSVGPMYVVFFIIALLGLLIPIRRLSPAPSIPQRSRNS